MVCAFKSNNKQCSDPELRRKWKPKVAVVKHCHWCQLSMNLIEECKMNERVGKRMRFGRNPPLWVPAAIKRKKTLEYNYPKTTP